MIFIISQLLSNLFSKQKKKTNLCNKIISDNKDDLLAKSIIDSLGIYPSYSGPTGQWATCSHLFHLTAINVGCEFRDRGSIPSVCQIKDADLGQVG